MNNQSTHAMVRRDPQTGDAYVFDSDDRFISITKELNIVSSRIPPYEATIEPLEHVFKRISKTIHSTEGK
ncbi:MAG TPA: hypothetical protein PKM25_17165 [Candidatus Ozemobacteraceae bacterium]|nr:hypothetical protein [Candidatus Ozemobacteraceae bacterium]